VTVGVAIRVPGHGVVLACDSRISDDTTGKIYSDSDHKWGVFGSVVGIYAGAMGGFWNQMRTNPPKTWDELHARVTDLDAKEHDRDYEVMVYDRVQDRLIHTDHQGDAIPVGNHGTIGCGGPIALGVLDATKPPPTLEQAEKLATKAIRIAIKRNAYCGGRVRLMTVPLARKQAVRVR
jgi:20S proteasome alpha/beta subunit